MDISHMWVFDSAPMREALARCDLSAVVALLRSVTGMSRESFAELVPGWSATMVGRIERRERDTLYDLRELLAFADAVMMPREMLLPLIMGDADATLGMRTRVTVEEQDVDRRTFTGSAAMAAAGLMLPGWTAPPPELITERHLQVLRSSIRSLWTTEWHVGGGTLFSEAVRLFSGGKKMLDHSDYSERVGLELVALCAEIAACAGFLAYDSNDQTAARRLFSEAVILADDIQDPQLAAHVFATMALHSSHLGRITRQPGPAREALRLLDRAAAVAKHEPSPRLHALIKIRKAPAFALLGDAASARRAISAARRELDRGPHESDPEALGFVTEAEVTGFYAQALFDLDKPDEALHGYLTVLEHDGLFPRNRVLYQAKVAQSLHAMGDRSSAVHEGLCALSALEGGIASIRSLELLRPICEVGDEEFQSRFDALAAALAVE